MKLRLPLALLAAILPILPYPSAAAVSDGNLGNVMYVGDSITHGYNAGSWRWAMHKIFVDNGVACTPVGVNTGNNNGSFAGGGYGGTNFSNVHSSQSSARAYEIAGRRRGGRFGNSNIQNWLGQSTTKTDGTEYTGQTFTGSNRPDTFFLMIGTNDLLSENASIGTGENLARTQANLLGTKSANNTWSGMGDMDTIINAMKLSNPAANIILTTVPCWTDNRSNNNSAADFAAMASYNTAMAEWAAWKGGITLIDVNKGLMDIVRTDKPGTAVRTMFSDGLHPNAQGELIIAGNMAKAMGYAGRSAGQARKGTSDLSVNFGSIPLITQAELTAKGFTANNVTIADNRINFNLAGNSTLTRNWEAPQTLQNGYTVDFTLRLGDGGTGGWNTAENFSLNLGNGTLNVNEAYIQWGGKILYSADMSSNTETLRVAYIKGDPSNSLSSGYYIWLGDMLIGEAEAPTGVSSSGLLFSYSGGLDSVLSNLALDGTTSYAPSSTGTTGPLDPYLAQQGTPPDMTDRPGMIEWTSEPATVLQNTAGGALNIRNSANSHVVELTTSGTYTTIHANSGNNGSAAAPQDLWVTIGESTAMATSWLGGHTAGTYYGNINLRLTEGFKGVKSVFGAVNGTAVNGNIYLEFSSSSASFNSFTNTAGEGASVIGTYKTNINGDITMVFNAGDFANSIIGGIHYTANTIITGKTDLYVNGGTFQGNIYAGSLGIAKTSGTAAINSGTNLTITGTDAILGKVNNNAWTWITLCGGNMNSNASINGGTTITLQDVSTTTGANSERKADKFAGIIDGMGAGTVNGTKQMIFSNYKVDFLGTLQNFDTVTAKKDTNMALSHLGGAPILTIEDTSRVTLNGITDVTGELTVNGTGTLILGGTNAFTSVVKNQGQVSLDETTMQGNTHFTLNQAALNLSLGDSLSVLLDCSTFSGTGDLILNGGTDSRLTLHNALTLEGNWNLNGGMLELRNDFYLQASYMPDQIIFNGGSLRLSVNLYNQLLNAGKLSQEDMIANRVILYGTASIDKPEDLNGYIKDGHYVLKAPQENMNIQVNTDIGDIGNNPTDLLIDNDVEMIVANSYTGATRISENSILSVVHDHALSGSSEIINNGVLQISGNQDNEFVLNNLSGTTHNATLGSTVNLGLQNDKNTSYEGGFNSTRNVTVHSDNGSILTLRSLTTRDLTLEKGSLILQSMSRVTGVLSMDTDSSLKLQGDGTMLLVGSLEAEGGMISLEKGQALVLTAASIDPVNAGFAGEGTLLLQDTASLSFGKDNCLQSGITLQLTGSSTRLNVGDTTQTIGSLSGNGTLHLGASGTGTLILQQEEGSSSFNGTLAGNGTLVKTGKGTQTIAASSSGDSPNILVQEGTMLLSRQGAAYGSVQVGATPSKKRSGGIQAATLIVGGSQVFTALQLAPASTLTFGSDNASTPTAPVRLTVSGDASLASGSTINMIIPSRSAQLYVQGQLTLGDSLSVNLVNNGSGEFTAPLDSFLLMRADQGFFDENGQALLNNTVLKNWNISVKNAISLFYNAGEAYIDGKLLKADAIQKTENDLVAYAQNGTALAGASLIWNTGLRSDNSPLTALLNSILNHSENGDLASASRELAASAGSSVTVLLASQHHSIRQEQVRLRNRIATMGLSPLYVQEETPDFSYWVQGNSGYHKLDAEDGYSGYTQTTWGGTLGFDINTSPSFTMGGAFTANYNKLSVDSAESASGKNDECFISLFGRYKANEWTHSLLVSGGWNDASLDRSVSYSSGGYETGGSTSGSSFAALYEASYDFILDKEKTVFFQPVLNASIQTARLDSYEESGAGEAGLAVSSMKQTRGNIGAGFRVIGTRLLDTDIRGEFRVLLSQNLGEDAAEANVAYLANPTFRQTVKGAKEGSTGVQAGLGLDIPAGRNGAFFIDGDADLRSGSTSINGNVGYRYSF